MKKLKVLSLFDGMSCGQIALESLGFSYDKGNLEYYASEIKPSAITVTQVNYPNTIQLGNVLDLSFKDGVLKTKDKNYNVGDFDLILNGSPCQNFSIACIKEKRTGLKGEKSKLFYEFLRLLKEVNPKYYMLENVASMSKESKEQISEYLGVEPIQINSSLVSGALRNRLYWTNISQTEEIKPVEVSWSDCLDYGYVNKNKSPCLLEGHSRPAKDKLRLTRRYLEKSFIPIVFESETKYKELVEHYNKNYKGLSAKEVDEKRLITSGNEIYDTVRLLNNNEMEKLQTVPIGYTKHISRNESASLLGDGWTVDVITHLLKNIAVEYKYLLTK